MFTVVSGIKRSGTSAMMLALKEAGIPIGGFKYPLRITTDKGTAVDAGLAILINPKEAINNPRGYWEYTSVALDGLQRNHMSYDGIVMKVITTVLPKSNPDMVERVIMMIRDPRKILASRITIREIPGEDFRIEMAALAMMHNTCSVFHWMRDHMKKFKVVVYEELLKDPEKVLGYVLNWFGRGDAKWGVRGIDKDLDRSKGVTLNSPVMDELDEFHKVCVARDYDKIYSYDRKRSRDKMHELYKHMVTKDEPEPKKEVGDA